MPMPLHSIPTNIAVRQASTIGLHSPGYSNLDSSSIQTITFGIIGAFLALATGFLALLQLKSSWRIEERQVDIEMAYVYVFEVTVHSNWSYSERKIHPSIYLSLVTIVHLSNQIII
jgi:hypothetical protein